jgi:hypothetical protein
MDEGARTWSHEAVPSHLSKPGKAVWSLMRGPSGTNYSLLNRGYLLAVDNYYTDIHLFHSLSNSKTDCIGTVKKNRCGLPKSILSKVFAKSEKGNRVIKYCDRFFLMTWRDNKEVRILSSVSNGLMENDNEKKRPACIVVYNRVMPGVDLNDQMKFGRKVHRRRVKKYYRNLFYNLFDTALINCYIYYKAIPIEGFSKTSHNEFRQLLIEGLFSKFPKESTVTECTSTSTSILEESVSSYYHLPVKGLSKRCVVCAEKRKRTTKDPKTTIYCSVCDIPLCMSDARNCFVQYHEEHARAMGIKSKYKRQA